MLHSCTRSPLQTTLAREQK